MRTDVSRRNSATTILMWALAVLTVGYILPLAVAATRDRTNVATIGVLNVLVG